MPQRAERKENVQWTFLAKSQPAGQEKCMQTIDKVLSTRNLTEACSEVVKNKGAGGIDGMSVSQLKSYLDLHREELSCTIREGNYIPQPIRGKEIAKHNGKVRLLGIPTVVDRMLQRAELRVIMPQFEYMFSEYSHIVFIFSDVHELATLGSGHNGIHSKRF